MKIQVTIIVLYIITALIPVYMNYDYFDLYGNKCESLNSINYYTSEGDIYRIEYIDTVEMLIKTTDKSTKKLAADAVINEKGYLVFDVKNNLNRTKKDGIYQDDEGKLYFEIPKVRWNRVGILNVSEFLN